jgi:putative membrane protein insertion efficiency factor
LKEHNKQVYDHLPSTAEIIAAYEKGLENDPTSTHYKRINDKPELHLFRVFVVSFLVLILLIGFFFLSYFLSSSITTSIIVSVAFLFIVIIIHLKKIFVWCVKLYQNIAPKKLRNKCRFVPSCSQYMILAIEKYGFFKGVKKGLNRIRRCKYPNGGIDYP